jgi:hypothetical protein
MATIRELIEQLNPDEWRKSVGFSSDLDECSKILVNKSESRRKKIDGLQKWVSEGQPCIFGKIAAGRDLISFCLLDEDDLRGTDSEIQEKIQAERSAWKVAGSQGEKNAFVIVAASEQISLAQPDDNLKKLAIRLFSLYLVEEKEIVEDRVYQDEIFIHDFPPTGKGLAFRVGSNFFGAQGDKRWWHDHRIPGGIGFSMNSPGHMAIAGEQRSRWLEGYKRALHEQGGSRASEKLTELKAQIEELRRNSIDSLSDVLRYAMLTILNASEEEGSESEQAGKERRHFSGGKLNRLVLLPISRRTPS